MSKQSLVPCYHPTTIYWVDDNREFLLNASLSLAPDFPYRLYLSPFKVLEALEPQIRKRPPWKRFIELDRKNLDFDLNDILLRCKFSKFMMEINRSVRFERVSVVIVDYAMGEMDGLELSRNLRRGPFKIILLTGKADEKKAVEAFNEGIIDCFLFKNQNDMEEVLKKEIPRLQQKFFYDQTAAVRDSLYQSPYDFLGDPLFIDFFLKFCRENKFIEYYLSRNPMGFYLIDPWGVIRFLSIQTERDLHDHATLTRILEGPEELIRSLESGRWVPFFPNETNIYEKGYQDWKQYLHPVEVFSGKIAYYYCLLKLEDLNFRDSVSSTIFPFDTYQRKLDEKRFGCTPIIY